MEETKYTWNDVIFSPDATRAKEAIGKKCYFADSLEDVLYRANTDDNARELFNLTGNRYPFAFILDGADEDDEENIVKYKFIIVKKEPKRKYRPFKSDELPSLIGTIVREKKTPSVHYTILGCNNQKVCMPVIMNMGWYTPNDLLEYFMLVDGTPCGVEEVEE